MQSESFTFREQFAADLALSLGDSGFEDYLHTFKTQCYHRISIQTLRSHLCHLQMTDGGRLGYYCLWSVFLHQRSFNASERPISSSTSNPLFFCWRSSENVDF